MIRETPKERICELYVSKSFADKAENKAFLKQLQGSAGTGGFAVFETVADEVFARMSDTVTPQGILAVVCMQEADAEQLLQKENGLFLMLENLQDPGNLGTILRTAEGAGVDGIFMSRDTADIYNPKTIRSTMGSVFRVPFCYVENLCALAEKMQKAGVMVCAAHLAGAKPYDEIDYHKKTTIVIGNEGNGLTEELAGLADERVKIPMEGALESLNAAVSAAILLYEAKRQRK